MAVNKGVAIAVAIVGVLLTLNMSGVVTRDVIKQQMQKNKAQLVGMGLSGNMVLGGVDIIMILACSPLSWALELYAGWIYGVQVGVLTILIAKNIAASLAFLLGKSLMRGWVNNLIKKSGSFKSFHRASGASGWSLVLAGRLSPLPSYVCSYGFAITDVSFHDYILATLLAGCPMVFQNVFMGSIATKLDDLFSGAGGKNDSPASLLFKFGFPVLGSVLIVLWLKKFLAKLADDATSGRLVNSRQSSPAATSPRSPVAASPKSSKALFSPPAQRGRPSTKSPAPPQSPKTSKSPAPARGKSPAKKTPKKTPAKAAARTPSPRRTRQTPRK